MTDEWFQEYAFKHWNGMELKLPEIFADIVEERMHPITRFKNPKFDYIYYYDDPVGERSFSVKIVPESLFLKAWV